MIKWKSLWLYIIFCNFSLNFANQNENEPQIVIENVIPTKINDNVLKIVIRKENGPVLFNLTLKKTKGILANHDTPIFTCLDDFGDEKRSIKFYQDLKVMQKVGNFSFYHDIDKKASAVLFSDKRGTYLEGIIGDQIRIHYFPMNYLNSFFNRSPRHAIQVKTKKKADNVGSIRKLDDETARKLGSAGDIVKNYVKNDKNDPSVTNDVEVFYPEILVLLDYESAMKKPRVEIVKKLLVYWNAVDMLFASMESPKISLNLAAIILPTSEKSFPFLNSDPSENYVDFTDAIETVENFFYEYRNQITFDYDIIAAMTGAQLCVAPNQANPLMNCINGFAEPLPDITNKFDDDDELVTSAMVLHYDNKISSYSNAAQKLGYMFAGQFTRKQKLKTCPGIMEEYYRKDKFSLTWSTCTKKKFETYLQSPKAQGLKNFPTYLPESLKYDQPIEEDEDIEPVSEPEIKPLKEANSKPGWFSRIGSWLFKQNQNSVTSTTESLNALENDLSTSDVKWTSSLSSSEPAPPLIEEKEPVDDNFYTTNVDSQEEITEFWASPSVTPSNKVLISSDVTETAELSDPSFDENKTSETISSESEYDIVEDETTIKEDKFQDFLYTKLWKEEITPSNRNDDPTKSGSEILLTDPTVMSIEKQQENQEWVVTPGVNIVTSVTTEKSVYGFVTESSQPVEHTSNEESLNVSAESKVLPVEETDYLTHDEIPSEFIVPVTETSTLKNLQKVILSESEITPTSTRYDRNSEVERESEVSNTDSETEILNSSNSLAKVTWSNVETTTNLALVTNQNDDTQRKAQQRMKKRLDARRRHKKLRNKKSRKQNKTKIIDQTTLDTITQGEDLSVNLAPSSFEATSPEKPLVDIESRNAFDIETSDVETTTVRSEERTLPDETVELFTEKDLLDTTTTLAEENLTEEIATLSVTEEPVRVKRYNVLDDKIRLVASDEELLKHVQDKAHDSTTSTESPRVSLSEEDILAYERELATEDKFLDTEAKFSVSDDALLNQKRNGAGDLIVSTMPLRTSSSNKGVLDHELDITSSDDELLEHMQNDAANFPSSTIASPKSSSDEDLPVHAFRVPVSDDTLHGHKQNDAGELSGLTVASSTPLSDEELVTYKIDTPAFDNTALNSELINDETEVPALPLLPPLFDEDSLAHEYGTPASDDIFVNNKQNDAGESPAVSAISSLTPLTNEDYLTHERRVSISQDILLNHEQKNDDELAVPLIPPLISSSDEDSLAYVLNTTPSDEKILEHLQNNAADLPVSTVTSSSDEDLLAHQRDVSNNNSTSVSIPESSELAIQPPCKRKNVEVDVTLGVKISTDEKKLDVFEHILHGDIQNGHNKMIGNDKESGENKVDKENVQKIIKILERITDIEN